MKEFEKTMKKGLKKLKVFEIKRIVQMEQRQKEFFEEIKKERAIDDMLTVSEVLKEYQISRSTFDRWRIKGLEVYQKASNSAIRVKRKDVINYLKNK